MTFNGKKVTGYAPVITFLKLRIYIKLAIKNHFTFYLFFAAMRCKSSAIRRRQTDILYQTLRFCQNQT